MTKEFLPYSCHSVDEADIDAVTDVLKSDFLTTGPAVAAFEDSLANYVGADFAIACSSGTAALHLALLAMGVGADDTVIVPSVTFVATANAARFCGAEVLFSDVCPESGLMTADHLEETLTRATSVKPAVVIPVHLTGQTASMENIHTVAESHNIRILEDACHALGAEKPPSSGHTNSRIGDCQHSQMCVFSFNPVKSIAAGEGGALTLNDEASASRLRELRNHGLVHDPAKHVFPEMAIDDQGDPNAWYYETNTLAPNYRLNSLSCALAKSQLSKLDSRIQRRRELAELYDTLLSELSPLVKPITRTANCASAWHLYSVLIDFSAAEMSRNAFMDGLKKENIGSQVHYIPVHKQPYYVERYGEISLPGADQYYKRTLSLPLFPGMQNEGVVRVVETMRKILFGN